jgi:hypothetical protein
MDENDTVKEKRIMTTKTRLSLLPLLVGMAVSFVGPAQAGGNLLLSPQRGVLCDAYFCAGKDEGVSETLTRKYLGEAAAQALTAQGAFDKTAFTFANGVFCDLSTKCCLANRYFDAQGKRSGEVREAESRLLFDEAAAVK